jgi:hypothetical protein
MIQVCVKKLDQFASRAPRYQVRSGEGLSRNIVSPDADTRADQVSS